VSDAPSDTQPHERLKNGGTDHYSKPFTRLKAASALIGGNVLWIAVHALPLDAVLVASNVREFERVSGLKVENWA